MKSAEQVAKMCVDAACDDLDKTLEGENRVQAFLDIARQYTDDAEELDAPHVTMSFLNDVDAFIERDVRRWEWKS